jgi:hypothetical protein
MFWFKRPPPSPVERASRDLAAREAELARHIEETKAQIAELQKPEEPLPTVSRAEDPGLLDSRQHHPRATGQKLTTRHNRARRSRDRNLFLVLLGIFFLLLYWTFQAAF